MGAGVALWANATHVLKKLGVLSEVLRLGNVITRYQFRSQRGEELMTIPVDQFDTPALCIHRADLHAQCRYIPPEQFVLGQAFERFEFLGTQVKVHFASGLTVEADALIWCGWT